MNTKDREIVVVVHDAGGAEIIGAYLKKYRKTLNWRAYGAGPARRVFKRLGLPISSVGESAQELTRVMQRHQNAPYALIAAPGWMSKTEINALECAKRAGIKTIVYMDSWVDERRRFGFPRKNWQSRLPDEFWAGDKYAQRHLKKQFSRIPVRLVPNQYFKDEVARFRALMKKISEPSEILFVSDVRPDAALLLRALLQELSQREEALPLRIRYHPADDRKRYDRIISRSRDLEVHRSNEEDIVRDLVRAKVVIGPETTALVLAVLCDLKTVCLIDKGARQMLPFPKILRTHRPEVAARLAF